MIAISIYGVSGVSEFQRIPEFFVNGIGTAFRKLKSPSAGFRRRAVNGIYFPTPSNSQLLVEHDRYYFQFSV